MCFSSSFFLSPLWGWKIIENVLLIKPVLLILNLAWLRLLHRQTQYQGMETFK